MNRWVARAWAEDCRLTKILSWVGDLYGLFTGARMSCRPSGRVGIPVIAVGNYTVGGAGKTPTVAALVAIAQALRVKPMVVTRGYGGRLRGPVLVDPAIHTARDVGDEALLHAALTPTIVARDRLKGAREAQRLEAGLVLLDDGFQNPGLAKDLCLVVVDRASGLGNGHIIPSGPLRAPLAVQLDHTHALVIIDSGEGTHPSTRALEKKAAERDLPVLEARLTPSNPEVVAGRPVVAFAGIGRPSKFRATLAACGAQVIELVTFRDHHRFTNEDAAGLLTRAAAADADLVTTAKDAVRLDARDGPIAQLANKARVVEIALRFDDPARLAELVGDVVRRAAQPRP